MDKRIAGVVGAISGLAAVDSAQAAVVGPNTTALPTAKSYAELLDPIPNALGLLQAIEASEAAQGAAISDPEAGVTLVGWHHHHHRRWWRHHHHHHRWRHHHHHHHHHRY